MKRIIISSTTLFVAATVNAGEVGFQKYVDGNLYNNQPITVPCEAIDTIKTQKYDMDFSNPTTGVLNNINIGGLITYKPEPASLKLGDVLKFKITNGYTHPDTGNCWLVLDEDKAIDTDGDSLPDGSYDLNNDGDINDLWVIGFTPSTVGQSNEIDFIISVNGQILPNNMVLFLACQDINNSSESYVNDIDSDSLTNIDFDTIYNPILLLNPSSKDDKVCVKVEGYDSNGFHITNLDSIENCFIQFECQFSLKMNTSISKINVYSNSNGKNFVEETTDLLTSSDTTELNASGGTITIENDIDNSIDDYIDLDINPANLNLKLWSDMYGCTNDVDFLNYGYPSLDFDNQRVFLSGDGNETVDGIKYLFDEGSPVKGIGGACNLDLTIGETTGDIQIPHGTVWQDDVYTGVDGVNRLRFVRWDLDESLTVMGNTHSLSSNDLPEGFFKKWEPNGTTLWVPMMNKWNTYIDITHNNPNKKTQVPASGIPTTHEVIEIRAKVWDKNENWCDNVLVGTFTDQGRVRISGKQIWNKTKSKCPYISLDGIFSVLLTVGAPERNIEAAVIQNTKKGIRHLPVYQSKERIDDIRQINNETDFHNE